MSRAYLEVYDSALPFVNFSDFVVQVSQNASQNASHVGHYVTLVCVLIQYIVQEGSCFGQNVLYVTTILSGAYKPPNHAGKRYS